MPHLDLERAQQLVRGRLPADETAAWEAHIGNCEPCARLVADERSWSNLLKLDQRPTEAEQDSRDRLLPRLEALVPGHSRRRRIRRTMLLTGCGISLAAAGLVWFQHSMTPTRAGRAAAEAGISETTQARVVANLDALVALRRDPWLADSLATVEMFERLLADGGATP